MLVMSSSMTQPQAAQWCGVWSAVRLLRQSSVLGKAPIRKHIGIRMVWWTSRIN